MSVTNQETVNLGVFSRLVAWLDRLSWLVIMFLMLLTVADVFMRTAMDRSILGTVELTQLLLVVIVFFSVAQTEVLGGHIRIDLLVTKMKPAHQAIVDAVTQSLCTVLFGLATWATFEHAVSMQESQEITYDLLIPIYPFTYMISLGCILLTLVLAGRSVMAFKKAVSS